jgi:hypothetical protein
MTPAAAIVLANGHGTQYLTPVGNHLMTHANYGMCHDMASGDALTRKFSNLNEKRSVETLLGVWLANCLSEVVVPGEIAQVSDRPAWLPGTF